MFTTVENVKKLTGYDVTLDGIQKAQGIIETYVGRIENDIVDRRDKALLARATAYQAAYMNTNSEKVFEQVALAQAGQNDSLVTYKSGDETSPWVAPLAVLSCKKLSWYKSRSVRTGRRVSRPTGYYNRESEINWWND